MLWKSLKPENSKTLASIFSSFMAYPILYILARANEIMYLQHRAELRRAKLAELGPEEQKKKKKKGKKGGKKLRRSNSFG